MPGTTLPTSRVIETKTVVRLRLEALGVDGPSATSLHLRDHRHAVARERASKVDNVVHSAGTPSADATYTYDAAYRLVEAYFERARPTPPNASGFSSTEVSAETLSYAYTGTDNVLSKTSSLGTASRAHVGTYLYESARPHAVTSAGDIALDYDAAGNATAVGLSAYTWDYRHKMVAATTGPKRVGAFSYDGDAVRVQKLEGESVTWHLSPGFEMRDGIATTWVSALGKKVVKLETAEMAAAVLPDTFPLSGDGVQSEPDGRITIGDAWVVHARREGFLPNPADSPEASLDGEQGPSLETMLEAVAKATLIGTGELQTHLHHDALGTTAVTTDEAGELLSETLHYPYGEWRSRSDDRLEVYSYTGVERDESTGLSANGARYLHLGLGRFTSPDPLFADLATVLEESPWEHNLYGYALGNPVRYADPRGEDASDVAAGYAIGVFNGVGMMLNAAFNAGSHHDNPMERVELKAAPGVWSDNALDDADFRSGLELGKVVGSVGTFFLARAGRRTKSSFDDLPLVKPRSNEALASVRTQKLGKRGFGEVTEGEPYLYVVNTANEVLIAPRGLAGRGGTKHTQLSGGEAVKGAGEIVFDAGGKVRLNAQSGRYRAQSPEAVNRVAQELSRSGYETAIQVDAF